jgi:cell division protein FtsB
MRARRDREINIFNIAFLDVITGALGAFILLTVLLVAQAKKSAGGADPAELERLRQKNQELAQQIEQLRRQNQPAANVADLKGQLAWQQHRRLLEIISLWECPKVKVATFMSAAGQSEDELPKLFNPAEGDRVPYVGISHIPLQDLGFDVWTDSNIHPGGAASNVPDNKVRFFVYLEEPYSVRTSCRVVSGFFTQTDAGRKAAVPDGQVLSAEKPWALVGEATVAKDFSITVDSNLPLRPGEQANIQAWLQKARAR